MSTRATRGMRVLATARTGSSGTDRLAPQTSAFAPSRSAVPKRGVMEFDGNTITLLLPPTARNARETRGVDRNTTRCLQIEGAISQYILKTVQVQQASRPISQAL